MKNSYIFATIALVCMIFVKNSWCEKYTELAGDLPKIVTADKSPYLVVADIFVPSGRLIRVDPGVVFLFKNFTGLHISGILQVNGTDYSAVIFTSENDYSQNPNSERNPTPYDWNGIYIHKDGYGTDLKSFEIRYSVKGIISETKYIHLSKAKFVDNGRANLTVEGVEQMVVANQEYNYDVSVKDARADGIPINILKDPQAPKRNILRYSGLAFFAGGSAVGIINTRKLHSTLLYLDTLSSTDNNNLFSHDSTMWENTLSRRNKEITNVAVSFAAALLGALAFTFSFAF